MIIYKYLSASEVRARRAPNTTLLSRVESSFTRVCAKEKMDGGPNTITSVLSLFNFRKLLCKQILMSAILAFNESRGRKQIISITMVAETMTTDNMTNKYGKEEVQGQSLEGHHEIENKWKI